jgi:uncharacterized membrane protein
MAMVAGAIVLLAWVGASPITPWAQTYDPLGRWWLSAICAALPVIVLLGTLAIFRIKAHYSAFLGLVTGIAVALGPFHMPIKTASLAAIYGACYGLFPIGWIVLNVLFLYRMTLATGRFRVLQQSMTAITQDTRLQLLLIAFSFGAFFEGASGFGTPVAVTAALLIGLGFRPLQASGLSLIANTAPVAYGALGTPIVALAAVTGYSEFALGAQVGRILPFFSVLVPFWLVWAYAGFRGMKEIWVAIAVAGITFAIPQYLVSNYHGPWLTDIIAALCSMSSLILFMRLWRPKRIWGHEGHQENEQRAARAAHGYTRSEVVAACSPGRSKADTRAGSVWFQLALRHGFGNPGCCDPFRIHYGSVASEDGRHVVANPMARKVLNDDDRGDALTGHRHSLLWSRRHHGRGIRSYRTPVPILRNIAGLVGRGSHRLRYFVQRAIREPAENLGAADRNFSSVDGFSQ